MTQLYKSPAKLPDSYRSSVFLAGSIEMGDAPDWQAEITRAMEGHVGMILNPRRDDWDSSWEQSPDNAEFYAQVTWELQAMENCSVIAMYFAPSTRAPITLLELGLHATSRKLVVCCPEGFWRKGNVEMVCLRHGVPTAPSLSALAVSAVQMVHSRQGGT